jgi:type VI protein secretion system component Hcp
MTATKTFFKTDDGSINHGQSMEVLSFSWGIRNMSIGSSTGTGGQQNPQRPGAGVSNCSLMFRHDNNAVIMQNAAINGKIFNSATISFSKQIGRGWTPYLVFKLKDVMVSNFTVSGSGTNPTYAVSLSFNDISFS